MMPRLSLFFRLIVRPMLRERARSLLIVFAVALGVAVVLAIDLAGDAAAGSFQSSLQSLAGDNNLGQFFAVCSDSRSLVGLKALLVMTNTNYLPTTDNRQLSIPSP